MNKGISEKAHAPVTIYSSDFSETLISQVISLRSSLPIGTEMKKTVREIVALLIEENSRCV